MDFDHYSDAPFVSDRAWVGRDLPVPFVLWINPGGNASALGRGRWCDVKPVSHSKPPVAEPTAPILRDVNGENRKWSWEGIRRGP
jgi:hypothetical protein